MVIERQSIRLGRKAVKTDSRTLKLDPYTTQLPPAPAQKDWTQGKSEWGMMLNDKLGCCTIAGVGHAVQIFSLNASKEVTVPDSTILKYYEKWDGYVDGDSSTDGGGIELDVLKDWRQDGFDNHKLIGFADANVKNLAEVRQAINLFGGVYIGFEVPNFIMNELDPSIVWDVVKDDQGIDGGHCVFVPKYDESGFSIISWGQVFKMTNDFWLKYVDEAHALLSADFIKANGVNASGFNLVQLEADLGLIR